MGRRAWSTVRIGAAVLCSVLAAAALAFGDHWFDHARHLSEGVECADCHTLAEGGRFHLPVNAEVCTDCHDTPPRAHPGGAGGVLTTRHVRFSHARHQEQDCARCHGDLSRPGARPATPDAVHCAHCHRSNQIEASCAGCHGEATRFKPSGHDRGWVRRHGRTQRVRAVERHGERCEDCHREGQCRGCHQRTRPRDHGSFWRMRGHGLRADTDRKRCTTCHVEAYCIRCHRETEPLNHRGAWRQRHGRAIAGGYSGELGRCRVCHDTGFCTLCHDAGR